MPAVPTLSLSIIYCSGSRQENLFQFVSFFQPPCRFSDTLGYTYTPETDGNVPDWLMDVVSIGFSSAKRASMQHRHLSFSANQMCLIYRFQVVLKEKSVIMIIIMPCAGQWATGRT